MSTNRILASRLGAAAASPATRPPDKAAAGSAPTAPPTGSTSSKFTILLDLTDGAAFDELHLKVKRAAGGPIKKSDIVRALLAIATEDSTLRGQVVERLAQPPTL